MIWGVMMRFGVSHSGESAALAPARYVEHRTSQLALIEHLVQGIVVDDRCAADIDKAGRRLEQIQALRSSRPCVSGVSGALTIAKSALGRTRSMLATQAPRCPPGARLCRYQGDGDDLCAELPRRASRCLSQVAETDHDDGLAVNRSRIDRFPCPGAAGSPSSRAGAR